MGDKVQTEDKGMSLTKYQKTLGLLLVKQGLDLDKAAMIVSIFKDDEKLT